MDKYKKIKKQVIDKVQEILDCSERAGKIEICITLDRGSVPLINYEIINYCVPISEDEV